MSFEEFFAEFREQIGLLKDNTDYGWEEQDYYTAVMLDYLEDMGEVDSPIICPYRAHGVQLNAYCMGEDYETLTLFVSIYNSEESVKTASKVEMDAALKRAMQLYRRATNDLFMSFERDNDTYEFAHMVNEHKNDIKKVTITALTNGNCNPIPFKNIMIDNTEIAFDMWDMDRLYRCMSSGKMRETIEIDFRELFTSKIPCIINTCCDDYEAYLAIMPGDILASIYDKHGARLLEKNVRSFLQVKGAVNKGIRDTLRSEPQMFLAYNNGISVTAENIEIEKGNNGEAFITKIRDMQIVNGGQTTASIYNISREKNSEVDLSKVYVQMKISVIKNEERMDEIVHKISECANTQNKIQMADFSSNDPFNRKLEELSRIIWAPAIPGQKAKNWFFERARGQYADMLAREGTPARRKAFKELHPLFTKTDLAKYENTWNQLPFYVSEGAQKNFKRFMVGVKERGNYLPDEKYYQQLVAKAILYRSAEKIVHEQKYGGYRANIVTYTIALISHKTAQRIDLESIWKNQGLSDELKREIARVSSSVHKYITNPPGNANISEFCKKKACWDGLLDVDVELSDELKSELISSNTASLVLSSGTKSVGILNDATPEEQDLINWVCSIPATVWFSISKWAKDTANLQGWQRSLAFNIGTLVGREKKPTVKQAKQAETIYKAAIEKGFIEE